MKKQLACIALFAFTPMAMAFNGMPPVGAQVKIGTDGLGIEYVQSVGPYFNFRTGYQLGHISHKFEGDNDSGSPLAANARIDLSSINAFLDLMPFGGGFRLTAGWYQRGPRISGHTGGLNNYDVGDKTYYGDIQIDAKADLGRSLPYLGLGWGGTTNGTGFGMSFDIGALFGKTPVATMTASGKACDNSAHNGCDPNGGADVATDPGFQAELAKQTADINHDLHNFKIWPVINFGLAYRF